jgi:hypothetical protein
LNVTYSGKTAGSTITVKVSHDGTNWVDADSGYRPGLESLGLPLKVRIIQSGEGFVDQLTDAELPVISKVIPNSPCAVSSLDNTVALTAPAIVGNTQYKENISGSAGAWANGTKLCRFWLVDNQVKITPPTLKLKLGEAEVDKNIRFVVVATTPSGRTVMAASPEKLVQRLKFGVTQSPTLTGSPIVGSTLKTVLGATWGSKVNFTYQWFRNSEVIAGATSATRQVQAADVGATLKVRVCGAKANFETKCLDSNPSSPVGLGVIASKPVVRIIAASTKLGNTLSVNPGNWLAGVTLSYKWLRDGSAIVGEVGTTHVVTEADLGRSLAMQITASKPGYTDLVKVSAAKQIPAR